MPAYPLRATNGTLRERARLYAKARRAGGAIRGPFRLPHGPGDQPSARVRWGAGAYVGPHAWLNVAGDAVLEIGAGSAIGDNLTVSANARVTIGPGCLLSARICLLDAFHDYRSWVLPALRDGTVPHMNWAMTEGDPISVGAGTWLGIGVVVMPGVTIGQGCVVGAGSVVTRDVPDFSIAAGVPAKVLRRVDEGPVVPAADPTR